MRVVTVCIFCRDDDWQTSALRGDLLLHGGGETNAAVACASDWTVPPPKRRLVKCVQPDTLERPDQQLVTKRNPE